MKIIHIPFVVILFFASCKSHNNENNSTVITDTTTLKKEKPLFFPVTSYIKGQVYEIKNGDQNPLKFITINKKTDSAWIKVENLEKEVADFLWPEIDSVNLVSLFSETRFFDQTLDAVTFTYDPIKPLPDTFSLRHWDVYVDPNSEKVKQVYILKKIPGNKTEQLRWIAGKSCNIKTIVENPDGTPSIEKEITLKWSF